MKTYNISITSADLPYIMEAIKLRALNLQQAIAQQMVAADDYERQKEAEARRAAMPDPFADPIVVPKGDKKPEVSRKEKRAGLIKLIKSKEGATLSTAEIARRAGVSYVTAHKARAAFGKGRK